jgi:DNA-binding NarL/FixJ family response regulator
MPLVAQPVAQLVVYPAMPGLGGEDVLRELARRQPRARVVITSGCELRRLQAA